MIKVSCPVSEETLFRRLYASEANSFWLECGRFAYMGAGSETLRYSVGDERDLWADLKRTLADRAACRPEPSVDVPFDVPFDFRGGYVGYFGYELNAICGGRAAHKSTQPDCMLLFPDRWLAFDRHNREAYIVGGGDFGEPESHSPTPARTGPFTLVQARDEYIANIHRALACIRDGDSYEVCLTNKLRGETAVDPLDYYCLLRRRNPAPHAAYLHFGDLAVASSSPELFLRISRDGTVETKPIKGTAPRGETPEEDEWLRASLARDPKNRAENLMIVDLLRNDLGRVCEIGSVKVPKLMHVESFATTHQLVSTVTGRLRPEFTAVDCLRAAFPGGSMTGAPKLRTLEIIDELETEARGVYSGSIGYLALNGSADLNIVIRTAVFEGRKVSIGAGGAIVAMSDPAAEWDEMLLKTRALTDAFEALSEPAP